MADAKEIFDWLKLANTDGVGAVTFTKLLSEYGSAEAALDFWQSRGHKLADDTWVENEIAAAERDNITVILQKDEIYPQKLRQTHDAPPILYAKGNIKLLKTSKSLAIVGSRNASLNARDLTAKIACELAEENILIVSGMARGIDTAAHIGALRSHRGTGPTIAVLGTGVDTVYPPENDKLYHQIAEQGLLLSEMPLSSVALGGSFPRRNRIISGLSDGVLVTAASEKSGSLITARFAAEQKRTLFAVPGSPSDPRAAGPNRLIRAGAVMVESADDIIRNLSSADNLPLQTDFCGDLFTKPLDNYVKTVDIPDYPQNRIEEFLSTEPADIDEIIRASGLDTATVMMQILDLEISGRLIRLPGNRVVLKTGR